MLVHIVRMAAIIILIIGCMLLPFLPGAYDGLAVTLSVMSQFFAVAGLMLVPIGALWLIYELKPAAANKGNQLNKYYRYHFAVVSVILSSIVAVLVASVALATFSRSFGLGVLALGIYGLARFWPKLKCQTAEMEGISPTPFYLIFIPIVVFVSWFALIGAAAEFCRNRAIANSAPMINTIEEYHKANGHYPKSLAALWNDFGTDIIGIKEYHYTPSANAFSLYFELPPSIFGTEEIVMYNKLDEHSFPSHNTFLLRSTPEQLGTRLGHYAIHDAPSPHWKHFFFD